MFPDNSTKQIEHEHINYVQAALRVASLAPVTRLHPLRATA